MSYFVPVLHGRYWIFFFFFLIQVGYLAVSRDFRKREEESKRTITVPNADTFNLRKIIMG